MRRIAPFLTIVLVVAGFWWALEGAPQERPRDPARGERPPPAAASATSRPAESRSEPAPQTRATALEEPESQPESRPESAPVEPVVVFALAREDGRPVRHATVEIRGDVADLAQTDEDGKAQIHARPGVTVEARIIGAVFYPFVTTVLLDSGTREIVVPTRSTVAGHLLVGGKPPVDPVTLLLQPAIEPDAQEQLPELSTVVGPDGKFEFFNLPETWRGVLSLPSDYVFSADETYALEIRRPDPDLVINLTELPVLKGRLVTSVAKQPIYGFIQIKAESDGSGATWGNQVFSSIDGRFRLYVDKRTTRVTLEFSDAARLGTKTVELAGPFDVVRNLGDVEIGAVRDLVFRVTDAESRPVAGAVASIPATWSRSEPTDADGRAAIKTDFNKRELRVGKLGYSTAVVQLPESLPTTLDVRLEAGNQLTVDVRLPDESVPDNGLLLLVLRSETPIFTGADGMSEEMFVRTGASEPAEERTVSNGSPTILYMPERGRVVVGGFRPGASFDLELRGSILDDLLVEDHVIMPVTGTKELKLRVPRMPQAFVGIVRDVDGKPIQGVGGRVFVTGDRHQAARGLDETDSEGRFSVEGLFVDTIGVELEKERFVPIREPAVPFTAGAERNFTMVATRVITVALVDEHGRAILDDAGVVARFPRFDSVGERYATPLGSGRYEIDELPPGQIDLDVTLGVTTVIAHHDSRTPFARVVVPTEGTAELQWRRDRHDPAHCKIVLALRGIPLTEIDVPEDLGDHRLDMKAPPGVYVAIVEARADDTEEWHPIATSKAFEIAEHLATTVDLRR